MSDKKVRIRLSHGDHPDSPLEWDDCWELWSFSTRHVNFKHPDHFDLSDPENIGLRAKLRAGTAFWLRYYAHGRCEWALSGEGSPGSGCLWDSVERAGILIWTGKPKELGPDLERRRRSARNVVEAYTSWCNGDVYGYEVLESCDGCGQSVDVAESCWGYYERDWLIEEACRAADAHFDDVQWEGDCAWLADGYVSDVKAVG